MGYENYANWPDPEGRARGDEGYSLDSCVNTRGEPQPPHDTTLCDGFYLVESIMAYEVGDLSDEDTLKLFAHLIRSGQAWSLQGSYGRAAMQFIEQGLISPEGDIL